MATIFDPTRVSTKREFSLHAYGLHEGTRGYEYVQANGAISVGAVCVIPPSGDADELDSANVAAINGFPLGVAQTAIPDDSYGWLQVKGPCGAIQAAGALSIGEIICGRQPRMARLTTPTLLMPTFTESRLLR